jgi:hypothetical protein
MGRLRLVIGCLGLMVGACGGGATPATSTAPSVTTAVTMTIPEATSTTSEPTPTTAASTTTTVPEDGGFLIEVGQAGAVTVVAEGEPVAVGSRIVIPLGSVVRLVVQLEAADEVHLHGYDLSIDATPGVAAELEFVAEIPGIFEVELEGAHTLLFELEVS